MSDADDDAAIIARERERTLGDLRQIPPERQRLEQRERDLVHHARVVGIGWDEIAEAIGMSEDDVRRHGEPQPGEDPF